MKRPQFRSGLGRALGGTAVVAMVFVIGACDLTQGPKDLPTFAEISIEGTSPNPLKLITSTNFAETLDPTTFQYGAILIESDTVEITPPFNGTVTLTDLGSVYVELFQPLEATASVRMRVNLDNGESYDQQATLADKASLIYYFAFFQS